MSEWVIQRDNDGAYLLVLRRLSWVKTTGRATKILTGHDAEVLVHVLTAYGINCRAVKFTP